MRFCNLYYHLQRTFASYAEAQGACVLGPPPRKSAVNCKGCEEQHWARLLPDSLARECAILDVQCSPPEVGYETALARLYTHSLQSDWNARRGRNMA